MKLENIILVMKNANKIGSRRKKVLKMRKLTLLVVMSLLVSNFGNVTTTHASVPEAQQTVVEESGYTISDVFLYENYADVEYEADTDCTILVALFDEAGTKMYASAKTDVSKDDNFAELKFDSDIPKECTVKGFVLEKGTNIPLAEAYTKDYVASDDYEEIAPFDATAHGEVLKSGSCGESVEWKFYEDGMLYISGSGEMYDYVTTFEWVKPGDYEAPWRQWEPLDVQSVYIDQGVTRIGEAAFYGIDNLRNVQIADSVVKISYAAFGNCPSLTNVQLPPRVRELGYSVFAECVSLAAVELSENLNHISSHTFFGCISLRNIEIPEGVETVWYSAFEGCTSLKRVVIPESVTTIGAHAFRDCTSLESITISESVNSIGLYAFRNSLWLQNQIQENPYVVVNGILIDGSAVTGEAVIPDGVEIINDDAFYENKNITTMKMPDSVVAIHGSAFFNCSNLSNIEFSSNLSDIGSTAFEGCSSLEEVVLPESITTLGFAVFANCKNLTTVEYSKQMEKIGTHAFAGCVSLAAISLPDSLESIGDSAFSGCKSLIEIELPEGITSLPEKLFYKCTNLSEIEFHNEITSVGKDCLTGTKWLNDRKAENPLVIIGNIVYDGTAVSGDAVIPEGITEIAQYAFYENNNLKSVKMPESVTSVGTRAFYNCANLKEVELSDNIRHIGYYAFNSCKRLETIVIPEHVSGIQARAFDETKWLSDRKAENPYVIINGFLYDVGSSAGSSPVVPDGVTAIGPYAFDEVTITNVTLPASVTEVATNFMKGAGSYISSSTNVFVADSPVLIDAVYKALNSMDHSRIEIGGVEGSAAYEYAVNEQVSFSFSDKTYVRIEWPLPLAPAPSVALTDAEVSDSALTGTAVTDDAVVGNDTTGGAITDDTGCENIKFLYNHPVIDRMYLFVVVKDEGAKDLLAPSNLLYIDMLTADEKGELEFNFVVDGDNPGILEIIANPNTGVEFGDVDENGTIDLTDANNVLKIALGIVGYGERIGYIADVDGDKNGTLEDANLVLKMALGIVE